MARPAGSQSRVVWGETPTGGFVPWLQSLFGRRAHPAPEALPALPLALRRGELAERYLAAEGESDHPRAGAAATVALEEAVAIEAWWPADIWGHRALWHFERAGMELAATRAARTIGEVRWAAGDPASARRYYAEAISEARDIGAEREEGLAALGLGRAELDLGNVTVARRLAQIAIDLFERCGAPDSELAAARDLRGEEKEVSGA
jgi:tetratricopeptide (TPR) repeat protein